MMFDRWCEIVDSAHGDGKNLISLSEVEGGRETVEEELVERVRSHYDDLANIAYDIEELGFPGAATILRERMPQSPRARSGEAGEILATEFVEFQTSFRVPVRRLRYKDGREMALRGDDFLGVDEHSDRLYLLKGEAKSRQHMTAAVIADARERLNTDNGRPTPISLLFVADRLLESGGYDEQLGRRIRNAFARGTVRAQRITHSVFTFSGNDPLDELQTDLNAADESHRHLSAGFQLDDHQDFIAWLYERAENLGDD